ncbi:MAG: SUMF1/EgtB/PvdO family nonheme iron enzyme, partial [Candidatus Sumerlaeia bacterium]|nr:SUMF1/EgtB/PvdO family nonheme iron enzyme [Candidatus Sumerlaeia bacterium]
NVWEWCQDWWGGTPPDEGARDPSGPEYASRRSMRGGGWYSTAEFCRSATRTNSGYPNTQYSNTGFRLAATIATE